MSIKGPYIIKYTDFDLSYFIDNLTAINEIKEFENMGGRVYTNLRLPNGSTSSEKTKINFGETIDQCIAANKHNDEEKKKLLAHQKDFKEVPYFSISISHQDLFNYMSSKGFELVKTRTDTSYLFKEVSK